MRVLHIDCGREMRGGQWQVAGLIRQLREQQITCELLSKVITGSTEFSPSKLRKIWRSFDVIHAHDARAHSWAAMLGVQPLVVSRRVAFPIQSGFLSTWKYSKPQRFIAISENVAQTLHAAGVPLEKIRVVHDGVQEYCWQSDLTGRAVAPAFDDPQKGSDLIKASGVDVLFSDNLARDLKTASCFIYISRQEGLGSAILLAMAAGVPVIASHVGGIPELVQHEVTGLLVNNEPDEIRKAWERLQKEKSLATALSRNAHQRFLANFTERQMAAGTLQVYRELL